MKQRLQAMTALAAMVALSTPALANYNTRYGTTSWSELPLRGMVSKNVWVGSWWSYKNNGIAYRQNATGDMKNGPNDPDGWTQADRKSELSPAEKYDLMVGRADKIERQKIRTFLERIRETESDVTGKIEERRELIRKLNAAIEENRGDSSWDWQTTDDGKKYLELTKEIEEAEAGLQDERPTIDTATEYEIWNHGTAQYGVQSWWGHCNAWAAAAIMEPEPRLSTTVGEVTFTAGDVKALITEGWMELNSSFHGSRNEYHGDEASRAKIDYEDITPAAFHILFSDQIANKDASFVIDRYTGDQVWNQPVKAFRSKVTVLNDGEPVKRELRITKYPGWGSNTVDSLGEMEVYEVDVTTTIHWVTDGVPHEELTTTEIRDDIDDATFANSSRIHDMYDGHIEIRTLYYTLWLTKHPDDPEAEIIGDGDWQHGRFAGGYEAKHPDFIWQPQANANNSRDYENEFIDYDVVVEQILPGSVTPSEDPEVPPTGGFTVTGEFAIPDADTSTGVTVEVPVEGSVETIGGMTVAVLIRHSYSGDLRIVVESPEGRTHEVKEFGTGGADDDVDRTWDVTAFDGQSANGIWKVHVYDQWEDDTGTVKSVEMNFK